jgi:hypothetical protein
VEFVVRDTVRRLLGGNVDVVGGRACDRNWLRKMCNRKVDVVTGDGGARREASCPSK